MGEIGLHMRTVQMVGTVLNEWQHFHFVNGPIICAHDDAHTDVHAVAGAFISPVLFSISILFWAGQ